MIKRIALTAAAAIVLAGATAVSAAPPEPTEIEPEPIPADECAVVSGLVPGSEPVVVVYNCVPDGMTLDEPYDLVLTGSLPETR